MAIRFIFLSLAMLTLTAHAETCETCSGCTPYNHPNPNCRAIGYEPNRECKGDYTFYKHPDERCKKILAEEYKAMVKQYLETVRKSSPNREE